MMNLAVELGVFPSMAVGIPAAGYLAELRNLVPDYWMDVTLKAQDEFPGGSLGGQKECVNPKPEIIQRPLSYGAVSLHY